MALEQEVNNSNMEHEVNMGAPIIAPTEIDLTYLLNTGMDVDILPFKKGTFVYSLTDKESKINDVTYTFVFAIQIQDNLIESKQ
jgi:hypothetical protein